MPNLEKLTIADEQSLIDINKLVRQLSSHAEEGSIAELQEVVEDTNVELWVAKENGHVIGMGALVLVRVPEKLKGRIEDVVVDAEHRGRGIATAITKQLVIRARERGVRLLELSSSPKREAANGLYKKLSFTQTETNVYRLYL